MMHVPQQLLNAVGLHFFFSGTCRVPSYISLLILFILQGNSLMRILNVAAFAVSGYASTEGRMCKPFNPLLGETYEADYPDKGLRFFSEKVILFPSLYI